MTTDLDAARLAAIQTAHFDRGKGWLGLPDEMTKWERRYFLICHENRGFMFDQWKNTGPDDIQWLLDELRALVAAVEALRPEAELAWAMIAALKESATPDDFLARLDKLVNDRDRKEAK